MDKNGLRSYLCCAVCALAFISFGSSLPAGAQTSSTEPAFEVATVKPVIMDSSHPFSPRRFGPHITPAGASYWSMTLANLLEHAFGLDLNQVTGPAWTAADRFDIQARFPEGADQKNEQKFLLALLKERFKLSFHIEKRDLEVYALTVGKHGAKLKPSPPDPAAAATDTPSPQDPEAKAPITRNPDGSTTANFGSKGTQTVKFDPDLWAMHMEFSKLTMSELASRMSICLGVGFHKIVNETGIDGTYQVAFDCPQPKPQRTASGEAAGGLSSEPQDDSPLTRSLKALGLKLEKRKMPTDVYIIDHAEKPSEN